MEGLTGDYRALLIKAVMDGIAAHSFYRLFGLRLTERNSPGSLSREPNVDRALDKLTSTQSRCH
jgi:hypothetical protein